MAKRRLNSTGIFKFLREIEKLKLHQGEFSRAVQGGFREVLGESASYSTIYHIGEEALQDPAKFTERIDEIFGVGSRILLRCILAKVKETRRSSKARSTGGRSK